MASVARASSSWRMTAGTGARCTSRHPSRRYATPSLRCSRSPSARCPILRKRLLRRRGHRIRCRTCSRRRSCSQTRARWTYASTGWCSAAAPLDAAPPAASESTRVSTLSSCLQEPRASCAAHSRPTSAPRTCECRCRCTPLRVCSTSRWWRRCRPRCCRAAPPRSPSTSAPSPTPSGSARSSQHSSSASSPSQSSSSWRKQVSSRAAALRKAPPMCRPTPSMCRQRMRARSGRKDERRTRRNGLSPRLAKPPQPVGQQATAAAAAALAAAYETRGKRRLRCRQSPREQATSVRRRSKLTLLRAPTGPRLERSNEKEGSAWTSRTLNSTLQRIQLAPAHALFHRRRLRVCTNPPRQPTSPPSSPTKRPSRSLTKTQVRAYQSPARRLLLHPQTRPQQPPHPP
mmetsp:Transcript_36450/g.80089  ORF Transcript_36450/g.80089 Transcript_36450/m.80089 type:complete len:402 (-) Transcript_36450:3595-4800(-)